MAVWNVLIRKFKQFSWFTLMHSMHQIIHGGGKLATESPCIYWSSIVFSKVLNSTERLR